MFRIRLHGRGGQGVKTAARILGSAFFAEGFEVQDAPRYGAERRGAPMHATVRAAHAPIRERGALRDPDLVVVTDDTLVPIPAAGVLAGVGDETVLLLRSADSAEVWRERLARAGPVLTLPRADEGSAESRFAGATCAGAAARLVGVISAASLESAIRSELAGLPEDATEENVRRARAAFEAFEAESGRVKSRPRHADAPPTRPHWIELPAESADVSAPDIHAAATSVLVRTGLWRTLRPLLDPERCQRCHWVCSTLCPDGVIGVSPDGLPEIDYEHCKGCMVCVAACPTHAISAISELEARRREEETRP
ncbi:MAG: 2-oxoacid:acceptor oxidoreductase family protein [Myxococcota bacterium]|nr:2-oxoacid:acceptor oxidoreductase family protein [Myxococcota bacterium]